MRFVESIFIGPQKYAYHIATSFLAQVIIKKHLS